MMFQSKLSEGQVMGERYRILKRIGSGGMSHVYLAEDMRLKGKQWAIKESVRSEELHTDIQAEAELLISLHHPCLPRVVDFYISDNDGYSYLIMDFIDGCTLSEYMEDHTGPMPVEVIMRTAKQLLEVLSYLHGHNPPIIYRDLKPSNIMFTTKNELMLIDFGIARSFRRGGLEDTVKLGTVGFAAPEQYGNGQSQPASDLYGLGALLLYMATGGQCSNWQPGMEGRLNGYLPKGLIPILRRLLRHLPEERYASADIVLETLGIIEAEFFDAEKSVTAYTVLSADKSETTVVALLGVARGLGTTHTSFLISSYLSHKGATAWVELSPHSLVYERVVSLLDSQVKVVPNAGEHAAFAWKGVHYWKRPANGDISELLDGTYQFVVVDLGLGEYKGAYETFKQSDAPLLIASGADWRLEETLVWLKHKGLKPEEKWRMLLPLANKSSARLLQSAIGVGKVYSLPLQSSPFQRRDKRMEEFLDDVLIEMTSVREALGRKRFFRKKHN